MSELIAQTAAAQTIGTRDRQEDAVVAYASDDGGPALAILSDGMGGHDDGDLASRVIASEMFSEIFIAAARLGTFCDHAPQVFRAALNCANQRLSHHIQAGRINKNTGGTLICATVLDGTLRWLSVGDSWLYVFRQGQLTQLNETHSFARQLDQMVENDLIDAQAALNHPDRNCLTSAVTGSEIPKVDCPDRGYKLAPDDIVILASDGIDILGPHEVRKSLRRTQAKSSAKIARSLLQTVRAKDAADQDNSSVIVIKMQRADVKRAGNWLGLRQCWNTISTQARTWANPERVRT
ncbi:MAG: protein phosphatase 2C domain-containing protein [Pseudomonadota bacterium]